MKYPNLYKTVKSGRKQVWQIWTDGPKMFHTFGFIDGKMRDPISRECDAKNVGKANATTAQEQAEKEALAKWKQQVEKGYEPECKEGKKMAEDALKNRKEKGSNKTSGKSLNKEKQLVADEVKHNVKIMKGKRFQEIKQEIVPGYVQGKFDGVRCKAGLSDDQVAMTSSSGKQFVYLGHIKSALKTALTKWKEYKDYELTLDGECYKHGEEFNLITACCRSTRSKPHDEEEKMEYHIFDIDIEGMKQSDRLKVLRKFFKKCVTSDMPLILAETYECDGSKKEIDNYLEKFEKMGFEGLIYRFPDGLYNTKSLHVNDVFKYKSFHDEEYKIVGAKEGKGTEKGKVVWRCTCPGGEFDVRMEGTKDHCIQLYKEKDKHIGGMLTVVFQEKTPKGIPRFPVGKSVRDYE